MYIKSRDLLLTTWLQSSWNRGTEENRSHRHIGSGCGRCAACMSGTCNKNCADMLTDKDKVYEAVMLLGVETDTQDTTGQVLKSSETDEITEEQVRAAVLDFVGDYDQVPPMYSAL